ncbi:MAG: TSUP family transporter, partial [Luminiphilus sp.]|nr:TSUP family transporter [Luminiphilus sp.]
MIEGVGLFLAGLIGGMVNAIAGGGSFITFPALMAAGVSPIAANATNTFASSAGYLSGAAGFRHELWAHRRQLPSIAISALVGGGLGAWLLLQTPENTFRNAIPWLLLLATVLLIWGDL